MPMASLFMTLRENADKIPGETGASKSNDNLIKKEKKGKRKLSLILKILRPVERWLSCTNRRFNKKRHIK